LGIKLSDLDAGSNITLIISNQDRQMEIGATIDRSIRENISVITINLDLTQPLKFENVHIEVEAIHTDGVPYIWRTAQILYYQSEYILQVKNDGIRYNRRNSFRVGVSKIATMSSAGHGNTDVMIRDVSLSGFSITDRKKELHLHKGDSVHVSFEDIGHKLNLSGLLVRIDERDDLIIYGFEIQNLCKDLSSYVSIKQRRLHNS